jgi:hypothetical protein
MRHISGLPLTPGRPPGLPGVVGPLDFGIERMRGPDPDTILVEEIRHSIGLVHDDEGLLNTRTEADVVSRGDRDCFVRQAAFWRIGASAIRGLLEFAAVLQSVVEKLEH